MKSVRDFPSFINIEVEFNEILSKLMQNCTDNKILVNAIEKTILDFKMKYHNQMVSEKEAANFFKKKLYEYINI